MVSRWVKIIFLRRVKLFAIVKEGCLGWSILVGGLLISVLAIVEGSKFMVAHSELAPYALAAFGLICLFGLDTLNLPKN